MKYLIISIFLLFSCESKNTVQVENTIPDTNKNEEEYIHLEKGDSIITEPIQ